VRRVVALFAGKSDGSQGLAGRFRQSIQFRWRSDTRKQSAGTRAIRIVIQPANLNFKRFSRINSGKRRFQFSETGLRPFANEPYRYVQILNRRPLHLGKRTQFVKQFLQISQRPRVDGYSGKQSHRSARPLSCVVMSRVRVVHWKPAEAEPLLEACRAAGHEVEYDPGDLPSTARTIRRTLPEALVIDLSRAPASGRELAFTIRHTKYTRQIPLIFVGGDPEKVEAIRNHLPDAVFTSIKRVASGIRTACKQVLTNPAMPPVLMERYGFRPAAQKLGIKDGSVALYDAPRDYVSILGNIPEGVELIEDPEDIHPVTLWFVRDPRDYQAELPHKRALAGRSKLWIIWTKGATNGLTGNFVREAAIEVGLVDYKICAVDARWSGMLFALKKK
jgi:hypothetical protein